MSSVHGTSLTRSDRAPLRDVQNELVKIQDTHSFPKHAPVHERVPKIKHEDVSVENLCISTTDVCSARQTEEAIDSHQDVTFKSFVCLEGEIVVEDEPVTSHESILIKHLDMENNQQPETDLNETHEVQCSSDNQTNEEHVEHPYSNASRSSGSDETMCKVNNVTFKSMLCIGGEVQIPDVSAITDESILAKDLILKNNVQSPGTNTNISEKVTDVSLVHCQPLNHSYCNLKTYVSSNGQNRQSTADAMFHTFQSTSENVSSHYETANTNHQDHTDPPERSDDPSCRQREITKSLCCSRLELESAGLSELSLCKDNPAEIQSQCCLNDISEDSHSSAVLTHGSTHADHIYCHIKENLELLIERSSTEIQISSECLTEKSENTIQDKMSGSAMCLEMESKTSQNVACQHTSQHLSTPSHCENEIKSSAVEQLNTEQYLSDNTHKVSNDNNLVMAGGIVEKNPDHHLKSFSQTEENKVVSCPQDVLSKNDNIEICNVEYNALGLKEEEILPEIEVMRLCDKTCEAVAQDFVSADALTGSCTPKMSTVSRSVLQDCTLSHLWPELPESPLPPPQFNSTALANAFSYTPTPVNPPLEKNVEFKLAPRHGQKVANDPPVLSNGPLQEQLRQMAELLMLASGKVVGPEPVNCCSTSVGTSPIGMRNVSVCRTPVQLMERSINTSTDLDIAKVHVSDASTITDSLLWNLTSGNLEHLSRSELEQRLTSTLIMVEVLSQQLSSARGYNPSKETYPSDLRDKLIQTDHTELRQNGTYRDLYAIAQEKIQSLEHDQEIIQSLFTSIQEMRIGMNSVKTCTEDAIFAVKQIGDTVHVDQKALSGQASQMKSLFRRYRETLQRMEQKMKDMRQHMEKALEEKEAAFSVTQQLRACHAAQVAELEHSVGSHQELMSKLKLAYPYLVELSKSYTESISAVSVHLRRKHEDHASILKELRKAQELIQRTNPVLKQLHNRALNAMEQSKQHLSMRDRAVEERDLLKNEIKQLRSRLQDASEQIEDLNMQQIIMNSEMSVLREQLSQTEEERSQLQRTNTELSATVTSTLASYAFLEKTLALETSKSQQSMHESHQATERVNCLEAALELSRKQIEDYESVLSQRETLIQELHTEAEIHHSQLSKLDQLQTELSSAREMTEFLQAENELAREQMEESERLLRSHLQGLRERNLECEDLKLALEQLRFEKDSLQEELDSTEYKARLMLLEQGEKIAQASNEVILLNDRVCCITNTIKESLSKKESESSDKTLQSHRSGSFVDSVMVAMMKTQNPEETFVGSEEKEEQQDGIGSEISAFTRIASTAHTEVKEERQICLLKLLPDLGETISDLQFNVEQLRVQKDTEQQALRQTICGLQEAQQKASQQHALELIELKQNVDRLQTQVEKDAAALQHKAQDEKSLRKLCSELEENVETAHKYRTENNELRREVADLRRLLQQVQVEAQVLRDELKQTGFQSATSTAALEERIKLLREVEKLKANLMETEENRAKVLERAKRHQRVHAMNQSKLERELHMLDDMIETVRQTMSSIPELVKSCPELQKLVEFLG